MECPHPTQGRRFRPTGGCPRKMVGEYHCYIEMAGMLWIGQGWKRLATCDVYYSCYVDKHGKGSKKKDDGVKDAFYAKLEDVYHTRVRPMTEKSSSEILIRRSGRLTTLPIRAQFYTFRFSLELFIWNWRIHPNAN